MKRRRRGGGEGNISPGNGIFLSCSTDFRVDSREEKTRAPGEKWRQVGAGKGGGGGGGGGRRRAYETRFARIQLSIFGGCLTGVLSVPR